MISEKQCEGVYLSKDGLGSGLCVVRCEVRASAFFSAETITQASSAFGHTDFEDQLCPLGQPLSSFAALSAQRTGTWVTCRLSLVKSAGRQSRDFPGRASTGLLMEAG